MLLQAEKLLFVVVVLNTTSGNHFLFCQGSMYSKALLLIVIEEFQSFASFVLHRICQILGECLYKINLRCRVLNEVSNVIFNFVSDHDFILLSSKTSYAYFTKHVLITHKTQILTFVFAYI